MKNTILFIHDGNIGDFIYVIPLIVELKETYLYNVYLHFQTNVKMKYIVDHPNKDESVGCTENNIKFLMPLLKIMNIFEDITYGNEIPKMNTCINFGSLIRTSSINTCAGNIQEWCYNFINFHLPQNFSRQHIFVEPNLQFKNKVIIVNTKRYNNEFLDLNVLKEFKNNFIFIGLNEEYEAFKEKWFEIDFYKINDALEFARILAGAKGIISNQNGLYSIAELMKVPRILMSSEYIKVNDKIYPGPVNVQPQGGWFEVAQITQKLKTATENLLNL